MGKLERKLDEDLIARMEASGTIQRTKPAKKKDLTPREGSSYRAARRNAAKGTVWRAIHLSRIKVQHPPPVRLNRSRKWDGVALTKAYGFPYVQR